MSIPFTKSSLLLADIPLQCVEQTLLRANMTLPRADMSLLCTHHALCAVGIPLQVNGATTSGNLRWHFTRLEVRLFLI